MQRCSEQQENDGFLLTCPSCSHFLASSQICFKTDHLQKALLTGTDHRSPASAPVLSSWVLALR